MPNAGAALTVALPLADEPRTLLGLAFDRTPSGFERGYAFARDLAADAAPLVRAAYERVRLRERAERLEEAIAAAEALAGAPTAEALSADLARATSAAEANPRLGRIAERRLAHLREREELVDSVRALRDSISRLEAALRAKEDAVATAVHELRNPLTSVQGYARLMARHLDSVQRQVAQLDRLIGDLLRDERSATAPEAVDVAREMPEAINRLRVVSDARVEFAPAGRPALVAIDAIRIAQVLDNLLRNAVKYSPAGEAITVELLESGQQWVIAVRDHGVGIAAEDLPRIFDRFFRAPRNHGATPGQGLGLAVCKEIVEAHGGRIWATSPGPGEGSTFWVALPAVGAEEPATTSSTTT